MCLGVATQNVIYYWPKESKCLEIFAEDKGKWERLTQKLSSPCQPDKS